MGDICLGSENPSKCCIAYCCTGAWDARSRVGGAILARACIWLSIGERPQCTDGSETNSLVATSLPSNTRSRRTLHCSMQEAGNPCSSDGNKVRLLAGRLDSLRE